MRYTSEKITALKDNEIFVFWSNWNGFHWKGAALLARQKFWAIQWCSKWLQWNSYAIITKKDFRILKSSTLSEIQEWISEMLDFAKTKSNLVFLVTKIGSWLGWYSISEIKNLFQMLKNKIPHNVVLPKEYEVRIPKE